MSSTDNFEESERAATQSTDTQSTDTQSTASSYAESNSDTGSVSWPWYLILPACVASGFGLAGSIPPWGWWPLAFLGIFGLDRLLAGQTWKRRFRRTWLVAFSWLSPAIFWMWDLAGPGFIVAAAFYALYFAAAAALTPGDASRRLVLPGAIAVAEVARWSWPFGGVPLAHLALSQVNNPVVYVARLAGPLLVVVVIVVIGQALSSLYERSFRAAGVGLAAVAALTLGGLAHPRSEVVSEIEVALVQGGGAQRTRASSDQEPTVLARHIEGSKTIEDPVDLILWPENVVNPGRYLDKDNAYELVTEVAADHDAPVLAGWFRKASDEHNVNYQSVITPEGDEVDRYDKVRMVPFGEYIPMRDFIVSVAGDDVPLPARDSLPGTAEPVLDTDVGPVGVSISWEGFFEHRARHAVREGAQILTNPTNGSSFWLTQVQTQQVASNQLRAIENDRWVLQAAPTGLTAVVSPDGNVIARTGISERKTLQATVEMRDGRTLASIVGWWPALLYGLTAIAGGRIAAATGRDSV